MTNQDIKDSLDMSVYKSFNKKGKDGITFRPVNEYGFIEFDADLLNAAFKELIKNIDLAIAGVYIFSPVEKVMYQLFMQHAKYHGYK